MTKTIDELEAELAQARQAETEQRDTEAEILRQREVAFARQRLADYRPADYGRDVRAAHLKWAEALAADPVFSALADYQAARWIEMRARQLAHNDAVAVALADGITPPHDPGIPAPPELTSDTLLNAIGNLVAERIEAFNEAHDNAYRDAVYGEDVTTDQVVELEHQAEQARRREAAKVTAGGIDVTGMTDADRATHGLPAGSPRTDAERRYLGTQTSPLPTHLGGE